MISSLYDEIFHVSCAHDDDIHAMLWCDTGRFASGSKDNAIKLWSITPSGDITPANILKPPSRNYEAWITALDVNGYGDIIYGTRDGDLNIRGRTMRLKYHEDVKCKSRNKERITTVYSMHQFDPLDSEMRRYTLVGRPRDLFCVKDYGHGNPRICWQKTIHSNDWVSNFAVQTIYFDCSLTECVL
jgi:WD40 repeat protein